MKYVATELLNVYLDAGQRRKVGRLAVKDRAVLFEYDAAFIASGLEISPFRLPLRDGVARGDPAIFDGLFGVLNDSLPDGWGRLLLDRAVEKLGLRRGQLTPLDRLAHVGCTGMGALSYEPDHSGTTADADRLDLDQLAAETAKVLAGEEQAVIDTLLKLNGASSGARPKVVAQVSHDKTRIVHGAAPLQTGFSHWMIKFASVNDTADIGAIEYAYSLMAKAAGVEMPETHLFGAKKKQRYFGAKRFDRDGGGRIHMHSLSGLLHADHRTPALDYNDFLKATHLLTKDARELDKAFTIACFNILAHNRDDHAKNASFLMDERGRWTLAPAYDLTFSDGPGGEQSMMVMGEGKSPGRAHLKALAKSHSIKSAEAIIERVSAAASRWRSFADKAGVNKASADAIDRVIAADKPAKRTAAKSTKTSTAKKPAATKRRPT